MKYDWTLSRILAEQERQADRTDWSKAEMLLWGVAIGMATVVFMIA